MLGEKTRNIIVGITMLLALVALMIGVIILGKFPFTQGLKPYTVVVNAHNAMGLTPGNHVDFNGVIIGSITTVELQPDLRGVKLTLSIDNSVDIPTNAVAVVGRQTIGTSYVTISLPPPPASAPVLATATKMLPKDGTAIMQAQPADNGLIPQSALDDITRVSTSITERKTLAEFDLEDPRTRVANISILVQRLERDAQAFEQLIGDPKVQANYKLIVENIAAISTDLRNSMKKLDDTIARANTNIDKIGTSVSAAATQTSATMEATRASILSTTQRAAELLASLQKTTDSIAQGQGTAGKLVHDPRLYEGLVDLTKNLKTTTDDLHVLIQKWSEEGVNLKLK